MSKRTLAVLLVLSLAVTPAAEACSLCGSLLTRQTLRTDLKSADVVVYGKLANARLNGPGAVPGTGTTDLQVIKVFKGAPALGKQATVPISRYIPIPDNGPAPLYVVFFNVADGKFEPNPRGRAADSPALLQYLEGVQKLGDCPALPRLSFYYQYLDHPDNDIATDAFLEFAKTPDRELLDAAPKLSPAKLRKLLLDPKTMPEKVGMVAFLLAAGKDPKDADLLRDMIEKRTPRTRTALDGLLCGLIQLQPEVGWNKVFAILGNKNSTFMDRYAAFRVLRFYNNSNPKGYQKEILRGVDIMLDGDMADMVIDSLRRWQMWERTAAVLGRYGKSGYTAPIVGRAIVRYALCCPRPEARDFIDQLRKTQPTLVHDIQMDLQAEEQNSLSPEPKRQTWK